jgi:hypothetical protein
VGAILREGPISIPADNNDMTTIARQLLRGAVPAEPWDNLASWPVWHQLLPHVLAVTDPTRSADIAWLLARAAIYLLDRGESRPARALSERAHQLSRDTLGEDHPDTLLSASILTFSQHPHLCAARAGRARASPALGRVDHIATPVMTSLRCPHLVTEWSDGSDGGNRTDDGSALPSTRSAYSAGLLPSAWELPPRRACCACSLRRPAPSR